MHTKLLNSSKHAFTDEDSRGVGSLPYSPLSLAAIPEGFGIELHPSEEPVERELVSLRCSADNYTYEHLQWYRLDPRTLRDDNGSPLVLDCKSVHLYADPLDGELSFEAASNNWVLELTIPHILLHEEGDYVCEVQNRRSGEKHCHRKYITVQGGARGLRLLHRVATSEVQNGRGAVAQCKGLLDQVVHF